MKKRLPIIIVLAAILFFGLVGSIGRGSQQSNSNTSQSTDATTTQPLNTPKAICDGTNIQSNCSLNGVEYTTYKYHPAVAEKSHTETVTTYKQEVSSYCTLCNDGTYSPSCATGRGTCSHHGGVAEWNAPRYQNVPEYTTKTVIDAPAQDAYFEKVTK